MEDLPEKMYGSVVEERTEFEVGGDSAAERGGSACCGDKLRTKLVEELVPSSASTCMAWDD